MTRFKETNWVLILVQSNSYFFKPCEMLSLVHVVNLAYEEALPFMLAPTELALTSIYLSSC